MIVTDGGGCDDDSDFFISEATFSLLVKFKIRAIFVYRFLPLPSLIEPPTGALIYKYIQL